MTISVCGCTVSRLSGVDMCKTSWLSGNTTMKSNCKTVVTKIEFSIQINTLFYIIRGFKVPY